MENIQQLFVEAGTLMFAGMVFVFAFLSLLIVFINVVLSGLAKRYPDPIVEAKPTGNRNKKRVDNQGVAPDVVAAISSAVTEFRKKQNK